MYKGKFFETLTDNLKDFIAEQKMFFTATAPDEGRVNLSPKETDSFRCIDNKTVAYLDLTGRGNETAAHIQQNGRMTFMFCSFTEKPLFLRLFLSFYFAIARHKATSRVLLFSKLTHCSQLYFFADHTIPAEAVPTPKSVRLIVPVTLKPAMGF